MTLRFLLLLTLYLTSCLVAAQQINTPHHYKTLEPASSSVLATGNWYKIKILSEGIYQISYDELKAMGFANPDAIRLFGNGGTMLPLMNNMPRYDDLVENAIYIDKGTDGIFNPGDFLLFYGKGPVTWIYNPISGMFEHQVHRFTNATYYFLTTDAGSGLRINEQEPVAGSPTMDITSFDDYGQHERNRYNLLESGRQWFGERIDYNPFDTTFVFDDLITTEPIKIKVNVVSRSQNTKTFTLLGNSQLIGTLSVASVVLTNKTGTYANQKSGIFSFYSGDDPVNINLSYNKLEGTDEGHLDYMILNARRKLSLNGNSLLFRDRSAPTGILVRYVVENCNSHTEIWDVTDPFNIHKLPVQLTGSLLTFTDSTTYPKEYLAVNTNASFPDPEMDDEPDDVGIIANQDLHAAAPHQMLIVTHPLFKDAADSIARFHRQQDNLSVYVATTEQVYHEFSSGAPDVTAIRDFARLLYNRSTGNNNQLKYLLLLGDGSYNNLSQSEGNANFILTYQSENSLNASMSYVSDDFFGLMEDHEGGDEWMENYSLDLGVGRLPVKTAEEAIDLYHKIERYNTHDNMGDWRNNILFVADDEDGNLHMSQANGLANWVDDHYPQFAIKKVLMDAYPQVSTSSGERYPDVNRIIINNIQKGILIFNYTGHGGELGLADEQILLRDDLASLTNADVLPLFVTATCEFSRFDDLSNDKGILTESTSAGEISLLNPTGGSIALLSTTRLVYSNDNHDLNSRFYEIAFTRDADGNYYKMGDVVRMTKNASGITRNKLNFILLGDPALGLAIPKYAIITDSLNHISVENPMDTLKAFSKIHISGHLEDIDQNLLSGFDGVLYPSVFDKKKTITTLANDNGATMQFSTREDLLYKGKASVSDGHFSYEFIVPKDITYSFGSGKITYYALNPAGDAGGEFSGFIIGGSSQELATDQSGPEIDLFLNDEYFNNQGITNPNPVIHAIISDESGINTLGNGIGHDITGIVDDVVTNPLVLNEFFEANLDDYTSGILRYPMENLTEGWHSLRLKVWDVYNNSSERTLEFKVISGQQIIIAQAGNYPNPASNYTNFTFEHNKPGEEMTYTIDVFDMSGRLIVTFTEPLQTSGFHSTPLPWDLKDASGNFLKQGIYPYRIRLSDSNGLFTYSYQKLVVIRQ